MGAVAGTTDCEEAHWRNNCPRAFNALALPNDDDAEGDDDLFCRTINKFLWREPNGCGYDSTR